MEFVTGLTITLVVIMLIRKQQSRKHIRNNSEAGEGLEKDKADEIITIIVPTINHDT